MFSVFNFTHPQETWKRPIHESPNTANSKTIVSGLTADFQEKIKNTFHLEKHRQNMGDRFPLVDDVGVYIIVCSRQKYVLPFVVKNVLDALSGSNLGYNNDRKIISVYAEYAEYVVGTDDVITIALYPETRFHSISNPVGKDAFIKFDVSVTPNDCIIQNPRTINHKLVQNPCNTIYTSMIAQKIKKQRAILLSESDLSVCINIHTINNVGDIDNYALPYLFAMENIVYPDIRNISYILLNLYGNALVDRATVNVRVSERTRY